MNILDAMKQSLDQLQRLACDYESHGAVVKLRSAIAEMEKAEPVAWMIRNQCGHDGKSYNMLTDSAATASYWKDITPLYFHPAPAMPEKYLPCGCVLCTCEDEVQCHGCGAKFCEEHNKRDHHLPAPAVPEGEK